MSHNRHRPDIEAEDITTNLRQLGVDLKRLLSPSSLVIDVGANRGDFALYLLELVGVAKVFAFEPGEAAFLDLYRQSELDNRIYPSKAAITSKNGRVPFYITESDVGSSTLQPVPGQPSKWLTEIGLDSVESVRLDTFIESISSPVVDLLKVDAQGADYDVLVSASDRLNPKDIPAVLVEIPFSRFYSGQWNYYEVFSLLDARGYRLVRLYPYRSYDEWLWWADALFVSK